MDHHVPTMRRILEANEYDTVLAYYNLLNRTGMEPPPPRLQPARQRADHPAGAQPGHGRHRHPFPRRGSRVTDALDRPPRPGDTLMQKDLASVQKLGFLLDGPIRNMSQAAMVSA